MLQFIVEATLLCAIGGCIGVFLGTSILYLFVTFNDWPSVMPLLCLVQ